MIANVQILRAVAALMVVHAHAAAGGLGLRWVGGANGVDLFFVISGFIIAFVGTSAPDQFMRRRLLRIVPIYWASTLALWALVTAVPSLFRSASNDLGLLVRSLLFIPDPNGPLEDGMPHPTLSGGWTLNYEMYFYVMFWFALAVSRRWATLIAIVGLLVVMATLRVTRLDTTSPTAFFYAHSITLEFVFGILAFHFVQWLEKRKIFNGAVWQTALLGALVVTGLLCLLFNKELFGSGPRFLLSGVPAFVVVMAAVLLEKHQSFRITNRLAIAIGDASYVLYLIQAYVVFGITRLLLRGRTFTEPVGQLVVVGLMVIASLVALAIYRYLEAPMLRALKRRFVNSSVRAPRA